MSEGIQLLPEPTEGWHWEIREVNVSGEVFWASMQERDSAAPVWWEPLVNEAGYSQGLAALMALAVLVKRFWGFWRKVSSE